MITKLSGRLPNLAKKTKEGATEVEYLLIIALTSIVVISALISMTGESTKVFKYIYDKILPVQQMMLQQ